MKYSKEQILEKYKNKNLDIFSRFDLEKYGLTDDHLLIDFSKPTDNLNQRRVRDIYEKDYDLVCNILLKYGCGLRHPIEEWFKLILQDHELDFQKDRDKYVELVTMEDKIVKFQLIIFRFTYIKALLAINMDLNDIEKFFEVNPFLFIVNTKSLDVDFFFLKIRPNEVEESIGKEEIKITKDSFICLKYTLNSPLESKPILRLATEEE